jgi:hypothetical protein
VHWPDKAVGDATHQSIVETLVSPVLNLLSQLRAPVIKQPLQLASTEFGDGELYRARNWGPLLI